MWGLERERSNIKGKRERFIKDKEEREKKPLIIKYIHSFSNNSLASTINKYNTKINVKKKKNSYGGYL